MIELMTAITNACGALLQFAAGALALTLAYLQWRSWRSRVRVHRAEPEGLEAEAPAKD